jgi:hypothetical protein
LDAVDLSAYPTYVARSLSGSTVSFAFSEANTPSAERVASGSPQDGGVMGASAVSGDTTACPGNPLPRIPPLRGRFGFNANWRGFSFKPEIVMAAEQCNIYPTETRTPGYTVVNFNSSYTLARSNLMHTFFIEMFNAGDRLYRNHLFFIKHLAPEMGD